MLLKQIGCVWALFICCPVMAQELNLIGSEGLSNLRGISLYKNTIWVSGSNGTVGRSADNGTTWNWQKVKDFEKADFRDIEALDEKTALIMVIASPGYILKTKDAGKTWHKVYENKNPDIFLDALTFKDNKEGVVIGDPINDTIFIAETRDGGNTWIKTSRYKLPKANMGEAFFAASGTNATFSSSQLFLVSGGTHSRLLSNTTFRKLPLQQGKQTTGANGIGFFKNKIMIVGGDFSVPTRSDSNCTFTLNYGKTFMKPITPPQGYRSAVDALTDKIWVTCGLTGIDISKDGGKNWELFSKESYNTLIADRSKKIVYLAGEKGKVGKIKF